MTRSLPSTYLPTAPFIINAALYETDALYPRSLTTLVELGTVRDIEMVQLQVFAGQYNPVTDQVTLYENIQVELTFTGGEGGFMPDFLDNPFESNPELYIGAPLNGDPVLNGPFPVAQNPAFIGEELWILAHPATRDAADDLAEWKNEKGIMTNVFNVGNSVAGRETASEIDAFIHDRYNTTQIKASYILLFGDSNLIPPFLETRNNQDFGATIGSDWRYAHMPSDDPNQLALPTFAVGRIPVGGPTTAQDVTDKNIDYEKTPPGSIDADPLLRECHLGHRIPMLSPRRRRRHLTTDLYRDQRVCAECAGRSRLQRGTYLSRNHRHGLHCQRLQSLPPPLPGRYDPAFLLRRDIAGIPISAPGPVSTGAEAPGISRTPSTTAAS